MRTARMTLSSGTRGWVTGLALAWAGAAWAASPGTQTITVREQLNQTYERELVVFPFSAQDGVCVAESLQLTGPQGPLAAQLTEIETWPGQGKYVKSARLGFVVAELQPLASATYTLTYGDKRIAAAATDLQIKPAKDSIELTTGQVGVRLLLGKTQFPVPVPAQDVPGPLVGMRLGSGAWAGGSALTGDGKVASWAAEVTAAGPLFARVRITYAFADGNTVTLTAMVLAGDSAVRWDMTVRDDRPELGVEFRLPPVSGVKQAVTLQGYGQWSRADRTAPLTPGTQPFTWLSPNTSIANAFPDCSWAVKLAAEGRAELRLTARDPAAWADVVAPLTYGGCPTWNLGMIPQSWENWKRKRLPLTYAADGTVTLRATLAPGARRWSVSSGAPLVGDKLDRVKDMVLDWPADPQRVHPRLFVDQAELRDVWQRAATDAKLMQTISRNEDAAGILRVLMKPAGQRTQAEIDAALKPVRDFLARLGDFDVMRSAIRTAAMYDAAVDSGLLAPEERAVFRAQMAYLAYQLADPQTWDMERGYHSGNPNMSCSYTLSLGVLAAALRDHPMAKIWARRATQWQEKWLADEVGLHGEWLPEGSHYGYVSLEPIVAYAIAAQRAGFHDFTADPRLKQLLLYFAKYHTPHDVQRDNWRTIGAYGRGHGGRMAVFGAAAKFYAKADPELSGLLQWTWAESGCNLFLGDGRLGGFEPYYLDQRLPSRVPSWQSELFPSLGALLRAGFNTPHESYVNLLATTDAQRNLDIWTPGVGGIAQWFGRGRPLSTCFTFAIGYNERHELLRDGRTVGTQLGRSGRQEGTVRILHRDEVRSVFQPAADRLRPRDLCEHQAGRPRLVPRAGPGLSAGDRRHATAAGLDATTAVPPGSRPVWSGLAPAPRHDPRRAAHRLAVLDAVGEDRHAGPGSRPSRLPGGQAGIRPAAGARTAEGATVTRRWASSRWMWTISSPAPPARRGTPCVTAACGPANHVQEYQDLVHLQQPGDGAYYVALFPRPRTEAAPAFTTLADGKLVKVSGAFGTDYALLAAEGDHRRGRRDQRPRHRGDHSTTGAHDAFGPGCRRRVALAGLRADRRKRRVAPGPGQCADGLRAGRSCEWSGYSTSGG